MTAAWRTEGPVRHRAERPGTVTYLPVAPSPQLAASGRPAASLMVAGTAAFLQLTAQWDPPAAALEALRERLTAAGGGPPPALSPPAGLVVGEAQLLAGETVLQAVGTSGFPPWTALFALSPDDSGRAAAVAALRGEPGHLAVRYAAALDGTPLVLDADVASWFDQAAAASPGAHEHTVASDAISDLGRFDALPPTAQGAPKC